MKRILLAAMIALGLMSSAQAGDIFVNGYTKKDGTYVAPHRRSSPDGNFSNNWSTQGNTNPYTGQRGTKSYNYSQPSYSGGSFGTYDRSQSSSGSSVDLYNNGLSNGSQLNGYR